MGDPLLEPEDELVDAGDAVATDVDVAGVPLDHPHAGVDATVYVCSGWSKRDGRQCRRLGHRVDDRGLRWCGTHAPPDGTEKERVPCYGLLANGRRCSMAAELLLLVGEDARAVCVYHDRMYRDLGLLRPPPGYSKLRRAERIAKAEEKRLEADPEQPVTPEEEEAQLAPAREADFLEMVKRRLAGLGPRTSKAVMRVLEDGLKATRWTNFTCGGCGKRNRVRIDDMGNRLATVKLIATELSLPEGASDELLDQVDLSEISTAALRSLALPDREQFLRELAPERNAGARVEWLLEVHQRFVAGDPIAPKQLERARKALTDLKSVAKTLEPLLAVSLEPRHHGPRLEGRRQPAPAEPALSRQ